MFLVIVLQWVVGVGRPKGEISGQLFDRSIFVIT